jgi:hypothetical protein
MGLHARTLIVRTEGRERGGAAPALGAGAPARCRLKRLGAFQRIKVLGIRAIARDTPQSGGSGYARGYVSSPSGMH